MPALAAYLVPAIAAFAGGVGALRFAWGQRVSAPGRRLWIVLGWCAIIVAAVLFASAYGVERGVTLALTVLATIAFGFIAVNIKRRPDRQAREKALTPSERPSRLWRGVLRVLLAGPISGVAAIGIALAVALKAPFAEADRLILGGALVPILWGAGMAWTLSDDRIIRATLVLLVTGASGFAIGMV